MIKHPLKSLSFESFVRGYLALMLLILATAIGCGLLIAGWSLFIRPHEGRRAIYPMPIQKQLTASDTSAIREWMTFDYINLVFSLPPDYLKKELGITDRRYPRLSIKSLARSQHADINKLLSRVQSATYRYFNPTK